ncbi:hypothetical protein HYDPIDRAFT_91279, partial [Hydnomerulius pinastri MD-312]
MALSAVTEGNCKYSTVEVLQCIRNVIRDMSTPSWFSSVPNNFGNAAAGTIKADEWHSLITVYIPIALISLWSQPHSDTELKIFEITMLQSYLKAAKLRAWLSHPQCPQAVQECKVLLDQAY